MSVAIITTEDLNDICSKDLSQPFLLSDNNADEITKALKVDHRVVYVYDVEGIIRESNNHVVVVDCSRLMTDEEHEAFRRMILRTRWRKVVIFCGLRLFDQQLNNQLMHARVAFPTKEIPMLNYSTRIEYGYDGNDIPEGMADASVVIGEEAVFSIRTHRAFAQHAIDQFIQSRGWMTFEEWHHKYPLRYKESYEEDGDYHVFTDRLTGRVVIRYDLGDPANTNPEYGGIGVGERFERKVLNQYERVCVDDCVVKN